MKDRKGKIIYYAGYRTNDEFGELPEGGYTVSEWLVYWTWQYLINTINVIEYEYRLNYITPDMPDALSKEGWEELDEYLELLKSNR